MRDTIGCFSMLGFAVCTIAAGFLWMEERPDITIWIWRIVCTTLAVLSLVAAALATRKLLPSETIVRPPKPLLHETLAADMPSADRARLRFGVGVVSLPFLLLGWWMLWIVETYVDGNTWYDWIVRAVLHELIFAVFVFAVLLLIWAVFCPAWIPRMLKRATDDVQLAIAATFFLMIGGPILFFSVVGILTRLGVM